MSTGKERDEGGHVYADANALETDGVRLCIRGKALPSVGCWLGILVVEWTAPNDTSYGKARALTWRNRFIDSSTSYVRTQRNAGKDDITVAECEANEAWYELVVVGAKLSGRIFSLSCRCGRGT